MPVDTDIHTEAKLGADAPSTPAPTSPAADSHATGDPARPAECGDAVVAVSGLSVQFGAARILEGVDLSVAPGEIVAVLGPSGCGKSTLLRAIAGLLAPEAGTISICGERVSAPGKVLAPPERRRVGYVFQDYALFPAMSVFDNVAFGLPRVQKQRAAEWLARIGMNAAAERRPDSLSGGEQQRVALARALAPEPAVVLLDEPLANIDAHRRHDLGLELVAGIRRAGASAILVTHDRFEAMTLSDRVAVLLPDEPDQGCRVQQVADPPTMFRKPRSLTIARLFGPCKTLLVRAEGDRAESPLGPLELLEPASGTVSVLLRPELLAFVQDPAGESTVAESRFTGPYVLLECDTPAGRLTVACPGPLGPPAVGTRGHVRTVFPLWPLPPGEDRCEVVGRWAR